MVKYQIITPNGVKQKRKENKTILTITGYKLSAGTFTNEKTGEVVDYDNILLYYITNENPEIHGSGYNEKNPVIKIKRKDFSRICPTINKPDDLLGANVELNYVPMATRPTIARITPVK